jgi:hypothetical protein
MMGWKLVVPDMTADGEELEAVKEAEKIVKLYGDDLHMGEDYALPVKICTLRALLARAMRPHDWRRSTMYDLLITKIEKNEQYEKQVKDCADNQLFGYRGNTVSPQEFVEIRHIKARIADDEFEAIKRALLEVWK